MSDALLYTQHDDDVLLYTQHDTAIIIIVWQHYDVTHNYHDSQKVLS